MVTYERPLGPCGEVRWSPGERSTTVASYTSPVERLGGMQHEVNSYWIQFPSNIIHVTQKWKLGQCVDPVLVSE
jgi:hypothetical protein